MNSLDTEKMMQAMNEMVRLYDALVSLRKETGPSGERQFRILAEGPLTQIRQLQDQIEAYIVHEEVTLWVKFRGPLFEWRNISIAAVATSLDSFRKSFQNIALQMNKYREYSQSEIKRASDLRLASLQWGSLVVGLSLPGSESQEGDYPDLTRTVNLYMDLAKWAVGRMPDDHIQKLIPDPRERANIVKEFARVIPGRQLRGVESVEMFFPKNESDSLRITQESAKKLQMAIASLEAAPNRRELAARTPLLPESSKISHIAGRVREINLDSQTFTVREQGTSFEITCFYEENLADAVRFLLDQDVEISGRYMAERDRRHLVVIAVRRLDSDQQRLPEGGN